MPIKILYEDDHLLVIDKPPGLVVTPSQTQVESTLADILQTEYKINLERGGIVHRLDKDTSGLILVAKDQLSFDKLQNQFKERTVKKEYIALVHGFINSSGIINAPIARNPENREKFIVAEYLPNTREAVTEYEPMQRLAFRVERIDDIFPDFSKIQRRKLNAIRYLDYTLVKCLPKTGRTHQIRVHLKYLGFPIVGDEKYAGRKIYRLDRRWVSRQFLHAAKIEFRHPITEEQMMFESPLPEDLKVVLDSLHSLE